MVPTGSTVQEVILRAHQDLKDVSDRPRADAQLLLANILGRSRTWIMTHLEVELSSDEKKEFLTSLGRYRSGEPLPYILGWWEFYGRRFNLNDAVLIPRPETEHIVELALRFLVTHPAKRTAMDIGIGSGCIAITLLAEVEDLQIIGTDISYDALRLAHENAVKFGVDSRLDLVQMDLTAAIKKPVDLICANLPYIPTSLLETLKVARNEPPIALNGGEDGVSLIRELLRELPCLLTPGGYALLEMEVGRSGRVLELARTYISEADFIITKDLSGHDRVLAIKYRGL